MESSRGFRRLIGLGEAFTIIRINYVIVKPLSTVEYTSEASVFRSRQWSD